jgi:sepiapterin reductase
MKSHHLSEPVLLITGAGKGLGEALVKGLIESHDRIPGLKLFLTSRTRDDLLRLQVLAQNSGIECEILAADLVSVSDSLVGLCLKRFGRLDALFHCAGVGRFGSFESLTLQDLEFVMKTNVEATFVLLQKAYGAMKSQSLQGGLRGQIQVITSVAAEKPFEQSAVYCMSKFAQRGLLEVIRISAYRDRIRILEVKPGAAYTPMWGSMDAAMIEKMMRPEEVVTPMIDALMLPASATIEELVIRPLTGDI